MHDYGFGDVIPMGDIYALSTYDNKIKIFEIPYT